MTVIPAILQLVYPHIHFKDGDSLSQGKQSPMCGEQSTQTLVERLRPVLGSSVQYAEYSGCLVTAHTAGEATFWGTLRAVKSNRRPGDLAFTTSNGDG